MQCEAAQGVLASSVDLVADDRVTHLRQVNPNLVFATGVELDLQESTAGTAPADPKVRHRELPYRSVGGRVASVCPVFREVGLDGPFLIRNAAFHDRLVDPAGGPLPKLLLQGSLGLWCLRKNQQS